MAQRSCDVCGKQKDLEGGKTCENGHFVCKQCINKSAGIFSKPLDRCPLDKSKLK
jgi:hypothetical protein